MSGFTATFTWHVLPHQPKQVQQIYITKQISGTSFPRVFIPSPDDTKGQMSCFLPISIIFLLTTLILALVNLMTMMKYICLHVHYGKKHWSCSKVYEVNSYNNKLIFFPVFPWKWSCFFVVFFLKRGKFCICWVGSSDKKEKKKVPYMSWKRNMLRTWAADLFKMSLKAYIGQASIRGTGCSKKMCCKHKRFNFMVILCIIW